MEKPIQILDRKEKVLRSHIIPLVKVLWQQHSKEEATWEREDEMKEKYPDWFESKVSKFIGLNFFKGVRM